MKSTARKRRSAVKLSPADALGILSAALNECMAAGFDVSIGNSEKGLGIVIPNAHITPSGDELRPGGIHGMQPQ